MFLPPKLKKTPFLQFRAGKMKYANGMVSADSRKGYLSFIERPYGQIETVWSSSDSETDGANLWKKGSVEVSFVEQCTTGRVLLFKVTDNGKELLHFFWLQDKSDAKDAEYLSKLKAAFKGDPKSENAAPPVQLEELKRILASISQGGSKGRDISLSDLVSCKTVSEALRADPEFYRTQLKEHLPTELASSSDIVDQVKNPQVTHAAALLQAGLEDPQVNKEVCKMYGIPENDGGVGGFLNAIIQQAKESNPDEEKQSTQQNPE